MKATILSYRRGPSTARPNQLLLSVESVTTREEATKLVGKKVVWETQTGKKIHGTITQPHGRKGCVVARFERGMPGQAIGTSVVIV